MNPHVQSILATQFLIPFHIKKLKLDLYIASDYIAPLLAPKHTKLITFIYDLTFVHFPETMAWKRLFVSKVFTSASMMRSRHIVTISDFIKRDIIKNFKKISPSKIQTIKCGVPQRWEIPSDYNPDNRGQYLLFVGNLEPRKNLLNLIKALELIKSRYNKDIPLHVVGQYGWKYQSTNDYIQRSIVQKNISFKGFLSETELQKEYLNCKAFLFPSIYEGFGIPVIEALKLDNIVLTSKGTVMQEIAGDAALYFDPHNPDSISEQVLKVYDPGFNRDCILKNKENLLCRLTWENAARKLLELMESIS